MDKPSGDIEALAPLGHPVRRSLYWFVVSQGGPVDRDAAAAGVGIGRPLAAFHLDRLAAAGLLEVEFRRRSGRSGPGAGRPAKFYLRARDRAFSLVLPPRHYDLAATILADGVEQGGASPAVLAAAHDRGAQMADQASRDPGAGAPALIALLEGNGYEPTAEADGTVRLRNCPFQALLSEHRQLTCSMNLALLDGLVTGLGDIGLRAVAEPRDGYCCVAIADDIEELRTDATGDMLVESSRIARSNSRSHRRGCTFE